MNRNLIGFKVVCNVYRKSTPAEMPYSYDGWIFLGRVYADVEHPPIPRSNQACMIVNTNFVNPNFPAKFIY